VVLFAMAPLSGKLTGRVALGRHLAAGLLLIGTGLLAMRAIDPASEWTALLPGLVVGGLGIGVISPALAAAMVSVLPVDRAGLASGINNTFRQLGIAVGIAGLGAILQARVPSLTARADFVSALDTIFLVAAAVALAAVPAALLLVRRP